MVTCIETLSCLPTKPLEVFNYWLYQYNMPIAVVLGIMIGIIIGAIYIKNRSLAQLSVMTIYALSVFGAMFLADSYVQEQYHLILYILSLAIASVIVMMILKLVKE